MAVLGTAIVTGCASAPEGMVSLSSIRRNYDLDRISRSATTIRFKAEEKELVFVADSRRVLFDGLVVWMNAPAFRSGRSWAVTEADGESVLGPLLAPGALMKGTSANRILLDPGHGGNDHGASTPNKVLREKDLVYDIAVRLGDALKKRGMVSSLTRERTESVGLSTRSLYARHRKSDVFISIHCNSAANTNAAGIETYVLPAPAFPSTSGNRSSIRGQPGNRFDQPSMVLAHQVHSKLIERMGVADRGIRRARWQVLKDAPCPAILVECGFLSNKNEAASLGRQDYRQQLAEAIAEGIEEYNRIAREANPILVPGRARRSQSEMSLSYSRY